MADADKSTRQGVEKKAASELRGIESHGSLLIPSSIVLPLKGDLAVLDVEQSVVGDGDTMGIACEVVKDVLGSAEWWFGVDHPVVAPGLSEKSLEGEGVAKRSEGAVELERPLLKGLGEFLEEESSKEPGEDPDG